MEIKEMQETVDAWINQFEEGYWSPSSMMLRLTEELGELAREINHLYGEKPKKPEEVEKELALELADILFIITSMANSFTSRKLLLIKGYPIFSTPRTKTLPLG